MEWQSIYEEMVAEIGKLLELPIPEIERVEQAFEIPLGYWEIVKSKLTVHEFKDEHAEIDFYKNIKPLFASYIEYLPLIYLALSILPPDLEMQQTFWRGELDRLQKFVVRHKDFVTYYKKRDTHYDEQYFLPKNNSTEEFIISKFYDGASKFRTSHDHLVTSLIAHEMYHIYVEGKFNIDQDFFCEYHPLRTFKYG